MTQASRPPTLLDDFFSWLKESKHETLTADVALLRYLHELPRTGETFLKVKQIGTRCSIDYSMPGSKGHIMLPNVSMRLQSALMDYTIETQPARKRVLLNAARFDNPSPA